MAMMNFSHRVGTIIGLLIDRDRVVGTTYGGTFTRRDILRP